MHFYIAGLHVIDGQQRDQGIYSKQSKQASPHPILIHFESEPFIYTILPATGGYGLGPLSRAQGPVSLPPTGSFALPPSATSPHAGETTNSNPQAVTAFPPCVIRYYPHNHRPLNSYCQPERSRIPSSHLSSPRKARLFRLPSHRWRRNRQRPPPPRGPAIDVESAVSRYAPCILLPPLLLERAHPC